MRGERPGYPAALDLMGALKLAVYIGLDEIRGDEFCAMLIIWNFSRARAEFQ